MIMLMKCGSAKATDLHIAVCGGVCTEITH